jgi:hypothetical protein
MPAQARRTPQQIQAQQAYRGVGDDVPTGKLAPEPTTNKVTPPRRAASPGPEALLGKKRAASPGPEALLGKKRAASPGPEALLGKKRTTGAQRTAPPSTTPIAAPFDSPHPMLAVAEQYRNSTIDQTGDAVSADNWFEASRAVEKIDETWIGTKQAPRRRDAADTVKRAVVPLVALAVVGFGVGYVVFHAATKKHATAAKPAITHVAAPAAEAIATPAAPSTESANAATATAGGSQPEPPAPTAAPHPNANEVKVVDHASDETPGATPVAAAAAASAAAPAPVAVATAVPAPAATAAAAAAPAPAAVAASAPAPAPVPAAVPATAVKSVGESAPVVHEIQTAHGTVSLVDIRIDSTPAGATVMLVDNGKTTFLGTTPVAASVDPGRTYDVVLTLEGRPTQMTHLDPSKTQRLDVTLGKAAKAAPAVRTASAPRAETPRRAESSHKATKHVAASAPTGGLADPGFDTPAESKADAGGSGTLMVSSKPPCEIFIDGNDSGKKTPQRAMSLPAGVHKVTFSNTDENITKTVSVKITADQTTKLIQDLMPKP